MPDVGVDIEAAAAVEIERDELLRLQIVAGQGQGNDEGRGIQRKEELPAVGMIIGMPEQHARPVGIRLRLRGLERILRPAQKILIAHGVVPPVENLAFPPEGEDTLGGAAFVPGADVDLAPALGRPAHDLDGMAVRIDHELAIAHQALRRRADERRLDRPQARHNRGRRHDLGLFRIAHEVSSPGAAINRRIAWPKDQQCDSPLPSLPPGYRPMLRSAETNLGSLQS